MNAARIAFVMLSVALFLFTSAAVAQGATAGQWLVVVALGVAAYGALLAVWFTGQRGAR